MRKHRNLLTKANSSLAYLEQFYLSCLARASSMLRSLDSREFLSQTQEGRKRAATAYPGKGNN
jgi:hypothetical protein